MHEPFCIVPCKCPNCGNDLPPMGELVAFRCAECQGCWIIGERALEPIEILRPTSNLEDLSGSQRYLWLPFWIADIDACVLARRIEEVAFEIEKKNHGIIEKALAYERSIFDFEAASERTENIHPTAALLASETVLGGRVPTRADIDKIARNLQNPEVLKIFVPAFKSRNTYAYLKVGRLLTRSQPPLVLKRYEGSGEPIYCALTSKEARSLLDFIFFSILGESLQSNRHILESSRLTPTRPLYLVELPFVDRGSYLISLVGGFWISGRLVDRCDSSNPSEKAGSGSQRL